MFGTLSFPFSLLCLHQGGKGISLSQIQGKSSKCSDSRQGPPPHLPEDTELIMYLVVT